MKQTLILLALLGSAATSLLAGSSVSAWTPIFRGIDQATGTNDASVYGTLAANALRIDLQDPDVRLFITPRVVTNYVAESRETLLQTPREFLVQHKLQVAVNTIQFNPGGYNNPSGTPANILGLAMSTGAVVSTVITTNECQSAMLFTTNNQPQFLYINWPPTSTDGFHNAIGGLYPLVSNGANISYNYTNAMQADTIHRAQPRTAFGLSQDNRYLIMITIDGRQNDFSDGALDWETADFLLLFGAWNAMNMDGGGSTCMVKATACGEPVDINQNSFQVAVNRPGSQRPVACNFGVYALPLGASGDPGAIKNLVTEPGRFSTEIRWTTESNAVSQVAYGPTEDLGTYTPLTTTPTTNHSITISGLTADTSYYFRAISFIDGVANSAPGCFTTTNFDVLVFNITNQWRYTTQNLNGVNWKATNYNDSAWLGPGSGLLWVDTTISGGNAVIAPKTTQLPANLGVAPIKPFTNYYFRTHFNFPDNPEGTTLVFSNYIDDGAVFYLNGVEIQRVQMPAAPAPILNHTLANAFSCSTLNAPFYGNASTNCPIIFTVSGSLVTNLHAGDNVLSVEVHNYSGGSQDITFGSALLYRSTLPPPAPPSVGIGWTGAALQISWPGSGFTLQEAPTPLGAWTDLAGSTATNRVVITNFTDARFYRLRN